MGNITEISFKSIVGHDLSDDERLELQRYNAKYDLVIFLYMEKMKTEKPDLKSFHFSPGDKFLETPTIDIVNEIIRWDEEIKNGNYRALDFGDSKWTESNPPNTGMKKMTLEEYDQDLKNYSVDT